MSFTLNRVTFCYPGEKSPALSNVTLQLPADCTVAILGPSGSGKTTLLYVLGLLWENPPDEGQIIYHGGGGEVDYHTLTPAQRVALRLRDFGFVLQTCYLLPYFSCLQNIALPLALQGRSQYEREKRADDLLRLADDQELYDARHRHGGEVSLGQRQRFAVLRSVIHDPCVVFADEPTSNLDPKNATRMLNILRHWRKGNLFPNDTSDRPRSLVTDSGRASDPSSSFEQSPHSTTSHPRTLILVCHNLETALLHADWLSVVEKDHHVIEAFDYRAWSDHAEKVNPILGTYVDPDFVRRHRP